MTFDDLLEGMNLPNTAKVQLPLVLKEDTKMKLMKRIDAEVLLQTAIEEINHGAVESVDSLVRKML